jgi:hypothetical protein
MLAGVTNSETPRLALATEVADVDGDVLESAHDTVATASAINPINRQWKIHDMRHALQG